MTFLNIDITVRFCTGPDALHATLTAYSHNGTILTILHESATDTIAHEIVGTGATERIEVADGESLTFIGRSSGSIVASQLCEVDCSAIDLGYILLPKGGFNLILTQEGVLREDELHEEVVVTEDAAPLFADICAFAVEVKHDC